MTTENAEPQAPASRLSDRLRAARTARGQSPEACAAAMGCAPDALAAYEAGEASPSLPELELLAVFLGVPVAYFLGERPLPEAANGRRAPADEVTSLRDRIIGAQVRQARHAAGLALPDLAAAVEIAPDQMAAYELGHWPLPVPVLERIARRLDVPVAHFLDTTGPAGEWEAVQRAAERLRSMPPELRDFVSRPINESYLRLAHQISQLSAERLRGIAESILEITL
jgi:transcriptional regulator with XRE-family HTH domain